MSLKKRISKPPKEYFNKSKQGRVYKFNRKDQFDDFDEDENLDSSGYQISLNNDLKDNLDNDPIINNSKGNLEN